MTQKAFYGPYYERMRYAQTVVLRFANRLKKFFGAQGLDNRIVTIHSRIKKEESMREKLLSRGLPLTREAALFTLTDAVGVRIVCTTRDDVYEIAQAAREYPEFLIIEEEDYIATPKESGYQSYHMLINLTEEVQRKEPQPITVELQIRTVEIDEIASIAHDTNYKQKTTGKVPAVWEDWEPYAEDDGV